MSFAMEMPSFDAISNLAAAQKSLAASKQAYENWAERYEQNENELQQALARQGALKEEKELRERDIAEGTKHLQAVWMALGQPPAQPAAQSASPPASTTQGPASPGPKRLTKEQKAAMSPEQKKAHKAAKKVAHDTRKALRTPEEQAKIDARVAKMQAALKASREAKKGILAAVGDDLPGLAAEGTA